MRNSIWPVIIITFIILFIDFYTFKGLRALTNHWTGRWRTTLAIVHWAIPVLLVSTMLVLFNMRDRASSSGQFNMFFYVFGAFILFYLPKIVFVAFHIIDDIKWILAKLTAFFFKENESISSTAEKISRAKFITQAGLLVATVPFVSVLWGMMKGRFRFTVRKETLHFENLPPAFDGFRIVQISDMHIGSFYGYENQMEKAVELINEQKADIVVFTGDMVNNKADELDGWENILNKIQAHTGKYSVLGNHDYGEYVHWDSEEAHAQNMTKMIDKQGIVGFHLLRNDAVEIERNGQKIALLGVENWGSPPFPQYGDFEKAETHVKNLPFKILLSHDPTHWDAKIIAKTNVDLTLSGHTHGMQMGIDIPGFRWSPVKFRYSRWGGLYQEDKQYLYVNIGFGIIGFPGRIGAPPEITVIELKTAQT